MDKALCWHKVERLQEANSEGTLFRRPKFPCQCLFGQIQISSQLPKCVWRDGHPLSTHLTLIHLLEAFLLLTLKVPRELGSISSVTWTSHQDENLMEEVRTSKSSEVPLWLSARWREMGRAQFGENNEQGKLCPTTTHSHHHQHQPSVCADDMTLCKEKSTKNTTKKTIRTNKAIQ